MFTNVGEKIKKVTVVMCIIGMVISIVVGILLMCLGDFISGLLVAVLGCIFSWLSSLFCYALGSIEDNLRVLTDIACEKALVENHKDM